MADDPRIAALLERWREAELRGITLDVQDLCKDSPELIDIIRNRLPTVARPADTTSGVVPSEHNGSPDITPDSSLGGFKLVRELGRGGMGIVYEAEDSTLGRRVALKTLHPEFAHDPGSRLRFLREARAAAALRHEHVVTLLQVGQDGEMPFLVMEYLTGETLADCLTRRGSLPVPEAIRVAREMAEGLAAAHDKSLIHRDIKPANVWLEAPRARVKLLDFGLARSVEGPTLTAVGTIAGTVGYMAPEQIFGGQLDGRTDLYALGCLLYQMLWNEMPFKNVDTMQVLDATVSQDVPKLDAVAKTVPAPLGSLLRRLLARSPEERPATAAAVAAELAAIERQLANPTAVPQPSTEYRRVANPGRRAGMWAGIGIVSLAMLIGLGVLVSRLIPAPAVADPTNPGPVGPVGPTGPPIFVGVLHSENGPMRDSEEPMVEAICLAIDEINAAGGVLGRPIKHVKADPHSSEAEYVHKAEELIVQDKVSAIFGCWTALSRKNVAEVCRKHDNLLIHSVITEGLEENPHVVNVGGGPNLQLAEAVKYVHHVLKKRKYYLVGTDSDLYSHAAHEILKDEILKEGGEIVQNEFIRLGLPLAEIAKKIKDSDADVIVLTTDLNTSVAFGRLLPSARTSPHAVPALWLSIGEEEMGTLDRRKYIGDLSFTPYFHSIDSPANKAFLSRLTTEFSNERVNDATEASYCAVHLWKQAVEAAGSPDPMKVREGFRGQTFDGPEGRIRIDPKNLYAWRRNRIAQIQAVKDSGPVFVVVKETTEPVEPIPFPATRTREEWELFMKDLMRKMKGEPGKEPAP